MSVKPKRLILGLIPNKKCDFKCEYCYITQVPERDVDFDTFNYSVEHMAMCLSRKRLGGVCLINLTGEGETLMQENIVELCDHLLAEGHFIELVTNLSVTNKLDKLLALPMDRIKRLEFKISFHYDELIRLNLMDTFWANIKKIQSSPCSFTIELLPHDGIIAKIDEIKDICRKNVGADCQITIGRADYEKKRGILTDYSYSQYCNIWDNFKSPMFDLKNKLLNVKRREFCYAGAWTLYLNMFTGEASSCYDQPFRQNIFENPQKPIKFHAVGSHCTLPYCINGHAHISMGVIPKLGIEYNYADIRNRVRDDGTEWFSEEAKEFFGSKLYESNKQYSIFKKLLVNIRWYFDILVFIIKHPEKLKKRFYLWMKRRKKRR